ncbi:MAG TPA: cytochrome b/b6 domain-containing protein, partial [Methylococcaceae bacterium]|nr:cytochrome b/b6 domain-containing protein [Methylococcaceae bacterium]
MNWRNSTARFGSLTIGLHWLMLLLLAAVYACIELRELFPKGSDPREALKTWHFMLGLAVFALVWLRLAAHLAGPLPRIEPDPPRWQKQAAKLMHLALFVFMIGMPLGGWLILSAAGKPESKPVPCRWLGSSWSSLFAAWFPGGATRSSPCIGSSPAPRRTGLGA